MSSVLRIERTIIYGHFLPAVRPDVLSATIVGFLHESCAVSPVSDLAPETLHLQLQVLVDGSGEDTRGSFYQISKHHFSSLSLSLSESNKPT